jgi:hypothetical protein
MDFSDLVSYTVLFLAMHAVVSKLIVCLAQYYWFLV